MASNSEKNDDTQRVMPNLDRLLDETRIRDDCSNESELAREWNETGLSLVDRIRFPWFLRQQ